MNLKNPTVIAVWQESHNASSLSEIGRKLGITRERVRQICADLEITKFQRHSRFQLCPGCGKLFKIHFKRQKHCSANCRALLQKKGMAHKNL